MPGWLTLFDPCVQSRELKPQLCRQLEYAALRFYGLFCMLTRS